MNDDDIRRLRRTLRQDPDRAATTATVARLRAGLAARAAAEGLVDVAYRSLDTPVGTLLLAATPAGLVRVAFPAERPDDVLDQLAARVSPRVLRLPSRLDTACRELDEYFGRRRRHFDVALDLRLAHGFRRTVLEHLAGVAYGTTASYAALAAAAGRPKAVRAVGTACATNPLPLVIPCHRVVRSDGSLGGYGGGIEAKVLLLALEAPDATGEVPEAPGAAGRRAARARGTPPPPGRPPPPPSP